MIDFTEKKNLEFENVEEFNKVWEQFKIECGRERWKIPYAKPNEEKWPSYGQTVRFQWIAETFRLWLEYRKKYLEGKQKKKT